jgi:hypothetical protein
MFFFGDASDARFKHLHVYEVKHKEVACALPMVSKEKTLPVSNLLYGFSCVFRQDLMRKIDK